MTENITRSNPPHQPLISIIIPNYNKVKYLSSTLNSIVSQNWQNWEAIIVDDGSTDGSQEIIKEFAESDQRLHFIQRNRDPKGGSVCRNIGIEFAGGEYMIFFDSDDLMSQYCIEQRINFMRENPELDFAIFPVGTFHMVIGDNKMIWRPKKGNHLNMFLRHDLPWNIMSPIWKTHFIKNELQGFDESFPRLQDVELHTRALLKPDARYQINKGLSPDCFYRIDHSRSQQNHLQMLNTMLPGVELFLFKFENLLYNKTQKKQLRGTLFSYLTQTNYYRCQKWIEESDYQNTISYLVKLASQSSLFSKISMLMIKVYNVCYQKGLWKIKGFNYLFKNIFVS